MSVTTTKFVRKPLYVDAVQVSRDNFDDVAAWCQGEICQDEIPGKGTGKKYIKVRVHHPKNPRQTKAMVGDWILYTERGYKIYTHKAFLLSFDEVRDEDHQEIVTIGPECFAHADGSVLSWKGVNYVPQEAQTYDEVVESLREPSTNGSHTEVTEAAQEAVELEEQRSEGLQGPTPETVEAGEQAGAERAV